jgi:hypothetical protein
MHTITRKLATIGAVAMALATVPAVAHGPHGGFDGGSQHGFHGGSHGGFHGQFRGGYRDYGWGPAALWGGLAIGLGIGLSAYDARNGAYVDPYYPGYVVVQPPPNVTYIAPPPAAGPPDPVIYPRNGQGAAQTEADRQACNRWATTLPSAMADAGVFQRPIEACMDARGYTVR